MRITDSPEERTANWYRVVLPNGAWRPKYAWCQQHESNSSVWFSKLTFLSVINIHSASGLIHEYPIWFEDETDALLFRLKFEGHFSRDYDYPIDQ